MQSGIFAARALFEALKKGDVSADLARRLRPDGGRQLHHRATSTRTRNMRLAFKDGFFLGGAKAGLMTLTGGRFPGGQDRDGAPTPRCRAPSPPRRPSSPTARSPSARWTRSSRPGNQTRDDIPTHLIVGEDIPPEVAELYEHMCPAGVYERQGDRLVVNAPNCIDCKATDVLGPRWTPREGGSGPATSACEADDDDRATRPAPRGWRPSESPVALLLIDVINDLEFDGGEKVLEQALPMARALAELKERARAAGVPVVYVNDNYGRWQSDFRRIVEHVRA